MYYTLKLRCKCRPSEGQPPRDTPPPGPPLSLAPHPAALLLHIRCPYRGSTIPLTVSIQQGGPWEVRCEAHIQALAVRFLERLAGGTQQDGLPMQHVVPLVEDLHECFVARKVEEGSPAGRRPAQADGRPAPPPSTPPVCQAPTAQGTSTATPARASKGDTYQERPNQIPTPATPADSPKGR